MTELAIKEIKQPSLKTIGWREWVSFPELGIKQVKAKVDTGARTSALHAFRVTEFNHHGTSWVEFDLHPFQYDNETKITAKAEVVDVRNVTDSGGHTEQRYVISTIIELGEDQFPIEVTLTDRDSMRFRMLLGRTAMHGRYLVQPDKSFLLSENTE
ncbi:MAG: ATP-dependent zinc protease [Motiliproteus sp.]|nr:ATP-dependent zinc protease [Motiliproteus sp.]MCW9052536.1 ATP-dependent zinc protease [Motiliproteus sp.]